MGINLRGFQTTIKESVTLSGIGVHKGNSVNITFCPADPDTGIIFHRVDNDGEPEEIRGLVSEIGNTDLCTRLGHSAERYVGTVEHLMATVSALGVDNLLIEIDGPEVPILDGSAAMFVEAFDSVGLTVQAVKRRFIRVTKPVRIEMGGSWAEFRPYDGTRFEIEIDFESPLIGRQVFAGDVDGEVFRRDIAPARTFGFMKDVEGLWASGHALGSSLDNSIVIGDDDTVINQGGLRLKNEFVRHKTLDAIGDLALAGAQFIGCFRSYRGGHRLNAAALRALLSENSAFEVVEAAARRDRGRGAEMIAVSAPVFAPWTL
jgi:UDP-3-O-[3-hydroxymyristoyl] N-acetylglucosamine deacetylase